jgi:ABC-2 type transport system permease protein
MSGLRAVLRKELTQMLRDRSALFFILMVPIIQLGLFGLIDLNVKHVPTVVLDQSRSPESRALVRDFVNTSQFDVVRFVESRKEMRQEIVSGRASVGVEIPPEYARRRLEGLPADFLVLIDGSDSSIASPTLSAANGLALSRSLDEVAQRTGKPPMALRPFPQLLFNPDSRSANLFLPGLMAVLLIFSGTVLAAFSIVKERERGTLEQLMVTPVSSLGVVLGKLLPFLLVGFVQFLSILVVMRFVFQVPIHGSVGLLVGLSLIYLFALLGMGLMVSSQAKTQLEALQRAMALLLPSVFLSGCMFPVSSFPTPLQLLSKLLPATHFIAIARGIIIRGATFMDLWPNVLALGAISVVVVVASTRAFNKTAA